MTVIRHLLVWQKPEIIAQALIQRWGEAGFIWLDGDGSEVGRWVTLAVDPIEQICCRGLPEEHNASNPFKALRTIKHGHWTGWLSYEAGAWTEPSNSWRKDQMATLWIASHDPIFKFDLKKQELWIEGYNKSRLENLIRWYKRITQESKSLNQSNYFSQAKRSNGIPISQWTWLTEKKEFSRNVNRIRDLIACGDMFQANLTACCTTLLPDQMSAFDLFQRLRNYCPAPFSGIVIGAGAARNEAIISASPERFIKVSPNGAVETRPIKGTRPRHSDPIKDADFAADLVCSTKDRAENVMIVDLLRNDLGRVCQPGSISVPQLVGLESFPQVHHLTSIIKGCLQENMTWVDLLEASWPGGSISGAPKVRACQRLYELEPTARGPYCGSLITINWDSAFDSNILIRSLLLHNNTLRANAGCGIVADSDANQEADELNWKLMPLLEALE